MNYFPIRSNQTDETHFVSELPSFPESDGQSPNSESFLTRRIRNFMVARMRGLKGGQINVLENGRRKQVLRGTSCNEHLESTIFVRRPEFYQKVLFGGTIGSAESFVAGDWETDNLTNLICTIIRNLDRMTGLEKTWGWLKNRLYWLQHLMRPNSVNGSRRNIHDHYDLGNDFYELFLDSTMNYSSGIFSDISAPETTEQMHKASVRKMRRICEKMQLKADDHVLEIGTGWGALAIYMAGEYGCRVTTTTISNEQYRYAVDAVRKAGLQNRIEVIQEDYRKLTGLYDKIVSIEMIEAVGYQYYDTFFETCSNLLTDAGLMLMQAITMSEQYYDYHIRHVDFIRRYIFPGGSLPSIVALGRSVGKTTDMRMLHTEDITEHYEKTLRCWRNAFLDSLDRVRALGYPESFIRMWHFYLCYCEAAFAERRVHNAQLLYCKPGCKIDPCTDYHFDPPQKMIAHPESRVFS